MAQYKVPQDVEADDKLLGPFTFRQFIYLIIVAGMVALAWGLAQIFILLALIPLPVILFFGAIALPLKKDQPMETYMLAIISFHLKPRKRLWRAGQPESTIQISAPKTVTESRVKDITEDEATHRLSFLSNLIDTNAQLIDGGPKNNTFQAGVIEDANTAKDMFEIPTASDTNLVRADQERRQELVSQMADMIKTQEQATTPSTFDQSTPPPQFGSMRRLSPISTSPDTASATTATTTQPTPTPITSPEQQPTPTPTTPTPELPQEPPPPPDPELENLTEQKDLSVATIAKEAKRIKEKKDNEVFISLR